MHEFKQTTILQHPIEQVYAFFSNAENLEKITPPLLGFQIITPTPIEIQKGCLIDYKLKIHGFPLRWRTLISHWEPPYRFVDQQLKGPYRQWIHEHTFEAIEEGAATRMTDHVQYSMFVGWLLHRWVRKDIETIFNYRIQVIKELFPGDKTASPAERNQTIHTTSL